MLVAVAGRDGGVKGGRERCYNTHPALLSLLQGLQLPTALPSPRSSALGIVPLHATRCQWLGTNDTSGLGFGKGEGGGRENDESFVGKNRSIKYLNVK